VADKQQPQANRDFDWDRFDPDVYFGHNYSFSRSEDLLLVELTATAFSAETNGLDILDVGTGSNLYPILAVFPRARRITAWEFSANNVAWLKSELHKAVLRQAWTPFWKVVRSVYGEDTLPTDPARLLASRVGIQQGSLFNLPQRRWDAATMFFCAESLTEKEEEFVHAIRCWTRAVKSGGLLVGAFIESSTGYSVGQFRFPAVAVNEPRLADILDRFTTVQMIRRIAIGNDPIRSGYSGMLFAVVRSK
jgi:NNMT/PNMT/TEMT family